MLREELINCATQIGDEIIKKAKEGGHEASFPAVHRSSNRARFDLLSGVAGILLFLANLYRVTKSERFRCFVDEQVTASWRHLDEQKVKFEDYYEAINFGFTAYLIASLCGREGDKERSVAIIVNNYNLQSTNGFDTFWGAGRELALLIYLYQASRLEPIKELIVTHAERLLTKLGFNTFGAFLAPERYRLAPLLGFAHGSSGIAWLLSELYSLLGDGQLKALAYDIFRYEDSWFNINQRDNNFPIAKVDYWASCRTNSWCDFRYLKLPKGGNSNETLLRDYQADTLSKYNEVQLSHPVAFCNGNAGIVASRLRAMSIFGDESELSRMAMILNEAMVLDVSHKRNIYNVCCGQGGNVETYLLAYKIFSDYKYLNFCESIVRECIRCFHWTGKWKFYEINENEQIPADERMTLDAHRFTFLKGTIGIGYTMLRLFDPEHTVSLLMPTVQSTSSATNTNAGPRLDIRRLRKHGLTKYWRHTDKLIKDLLQIDIIAEYCECCPGLETDCDVMRSLRFIEEWIGNLPGKIRKTVEKIFAIERYRIDFERKNRLTADRHFEFFLCSADSELDYDSSTLLLQRDVKLFRVEELGSNFIFHISTSNEPICSSVSSLEMDLLCTLRDGDTVRSLAARLGQSMNRRSCPEVETVGRIIQGFVGMNVVQKSLASLHSGGN